MTVAVRWQGKTGGAFGFALIFLLHFLYQDKKWKKNIYRENEEAFSRFLTAFEMTKQEALWMAKSLKG